MGCKGCGHKESNYTVYDRHGNVVKRKEEIKEEEKEILSIDGQPAKSKNTKELLQERKEYLSVVKAEHAKLLDNATDDMKRMMIIELISIYNHEEISMTRMSPTQALVALWKYTHNEKFRKIVNEFPGLLEEVDRKYDNLKKSFICSKWAYQ